MLIPVDEAAAAELDDPADVVVASLVVPFALPALVSADASTPVLFWQSYAESVKVIQSSGVRPNACLPHCTLS